jgi:hypothetical protein
VDKVVDKTEDNCADEAIPSEKPFISERLRHLFVCDRDGLTIKTLSGDIETALAEIEAEIAAGGFTYATLIAVPYGAKMVHWQGGHDKGFMRAARNTMESITKVNMGSAPQDIRNDAKRFRHLIGMGLFRSTHMNSGDGMHHMVTNSLRLGEGNSARDVLDRLILEKQGMER